MAETPETNAILVAECFQEGDTAPTLLEAFVSGQGVALTIRSPRERAGAGWYPWSTIAQLIIQEDPHLFGRLDDPLHLGFKVAMESLGFHVPLKPYVGGDEAERNG